MPLKTLILNILTFGYYALKKAYEDKINRVKQVTQEAEDFHNSLKQLPAKMIMIQPYNADNVEYQRKILEISQDPALRYFLYNIQQDIFEMLNHATDEKAVEIMGMSKGIKYLLKAIEANNLNYEENSKPKATGENNYV